MRILAQMRRYERSALIIKLTFCRIRKQRPHFPLLYIAHCIYLIGKFLPAFRTVNREAIVHRKGYIEHVAKLVPKLCRDKQPALIVDAVLIFACQRVHLHLSSIFDALFTTLLHFILIIEIVGQKIKNILVTYKNSRTFLRPAIFISIKLSYFKAEFITEFETIILQISVVPSAMVSI